MKTTNFATSLPEVATSTFVVRLVFETLNSVLVHFAEAPTDSWIRLALIAGDLIALPAGIYHRFTLDTDDNVRTVRLFKVSRRRWRLPATDSDGADRMFPSGPLLTVARKLKSTLFASLI